MADHVDLDLPLLPRHASTVRTVAASLAADAGFSIDQIDDLRLGVNEAVAVLTDVDRAADDESVRLHVRFELDADQIVVNLWRVGVSEAFTADHIDDLAGRILRAVVDEFGIDATGVFRVVKRAVDDSER